MSISPLTPDRGVPASALTMPTLDRRTLLKGTVLASALAGLSACGVSGTGSSGSKVTSLVETIAATPNGLAFDGP
ncbi:MAG: hypothetical protein QM673_15530, partial [Gordonia sp. (in: high G+C Gram-positive bacteria)]